MAKTTFNIMWLSIYASLLLPKTVYGLGMKSQPSPACLDHCTERNDGDLSAPTMEGLCSDTVKQRALFLCLLDSCPRQHYGPALAYTVSSCSALGIEVNPLYPVEVKRRKPSFRRLADAGRLMARSDMGPFSELACSAGPDGIITVANTAEGTEPSSMPNHASLPGGHRGPLSPVLHSELVQVLSDQGTIEPTPCLTCSTMETGESSEASLSVLTTESSPVDKTESFETTTSASGTAESAMGDQDNLSPSCETTSTTSMTPSTKCGCSVTSSSTPTPTSTSCDETPHAILSTESFASSPMTTTDCSEPSADVIESMPTTSSESMLSTTTRVATMPTSSSCETLASPVFNSTIGSSSAGSHTTTNPSMFEPSIPDLHFPKRPSQSPCSFSNSTVRAVDQTTTPSTTSVESAASSSDCSTSSTLSSSVCTTSEESTQSAEDLVSTISPTLTSSTPVSTSMKLPEYTTPSILPAYQPLTPMSIPEYGPLPVYGSIISPENVVPTPSTSMTSLSESTSPVSSSTLETPSGTPPQMYKANDMKRTTMSTASLTSSGKAAPSAPAVSKQVGDASSFFSGETHQTTDDDIFGTESSTNSDETTKEATSSAATAGDDVHPSELFVTIVAPDSRGILQTSIMTIEEQSPWATHMPRGGPNVALENKHDSTSPNETFITVADATSTIYSLSEEVTPFVGSSSRHAPQSPTSQAVATASISTLLRSNMLLIGGVLMCTVVLIMQ